MARRTQVADHKSDQVIYVGPPLVSVGLQQYAVFRGGVPVFAAAAVKECSDLAELFVPIDQLNHSRREIQRNGSQLRAYYLNARSYFLSR